jgi:ribosomal protein L7Ae-like RNA K-turn-binding protein
LPDLYSLLGFAKRSGNLLSGITNCLAAIEKKKAKLVLIASDAGVTRRKVIKACCSAQIPYIKFGTKECYSEKLGMPSCYWVILSRDLAKGFLEKYLEDDYR